MNVTGFSDDYNATFVGNELLDHSAVITQGRLTKDADSVISRSTIKLLESVIVYVAVALGIPGNILSAIVWLRLHVISKNSSTIYLAVLAINDLFWPIYACHYVLIERLHPSPLDILNTVGFYWSVSYVARFTSTFEPLLLLSFSVERLIAIVHPLKVCGLRRTVSYFLLHVVIKYKTNLSV